MDKTILQHGMYAIMEYEPVSSLQTNKGLRKFLRRFILEGLPRGRKRRYMKEFRKLIHFDRQIDKMKYSYTKN